MKNPKTYGIIALLLVFLSAGGDFLFAQETYVVDTAQNKKPTFNNDIGLFRIKSGGIRNMHDYIGGKVEFISRDQIEFAIPNSIYRKLSIIGPSRKTVLHRDGKEDLNLVVLDSLYIRDTLEFKGVNFDVRGIDIDAKGNLISDANFTGELNSYLNMNRQDSLQTLESNDGSFDRLRIENPYGIDLTDNTKFNIKRVLELKLGELRSGSGSVVSLTDSSVIRRYATGSIAQAPLFSDRVSVYYLGDTTLPIAAGPELPKDPGILQNLFQQNAGGLYLDTMVTINDTLFVGTFINTNKYDNTGTLIDSTIVLVSTSGRDPIFDPNNTWAEIIGNMRHTILDKTVQDSLIYHNPYTWIKFDNPDDISGIKELTLRVQPMEYPYYDNGQNKIKRFFIVSAIDLSDSQIDFIQNMTFGYGWKHDKGDKLSANYETNDKDINQVVLQRWDNTTWYEYSAGQDSPKLNADETWAYGVTRNIERLGFFAMGVPGDGIPLVLRALVFLEGPYLGDSKMSTALRDSNLVPLSPPDRYPFNLDTNGMRVKVPSIPENVVDWIVLQFSNSKDTLYRTCFLKNNGEIAEIDGVSPVSLGKGNIDTGYYYISVRHRNHLDVVTVDPVRISRDSTNLNAVKNFSDPAFVSGGLGDALKPVKNDNGYIYVMIAGESNKDRNNYGEIDYENDILKAWQSRNLRGHDGTLDNFEAYRTFLIYDYDMNGIITTKDVNIGWNNRGKISRIK